jgi:hypothetical protein
MALFHIRGSILGIAIYVFALSHAATAEESVRYKKFRTFFELLDQSGGLAAEFKAKNGDICRMGGLACVGGEVVEMCVDLPVHVLLLLSEGAIVDQLHFACRHKLCV